MEYRNIGIMEYWAQNEKTSDLHAMDSHPLDPSFHLSIFPLFHI
jgi:hypothetical protein